MMKMRIIKMLLLLMLPLLPLRRLKMLQDGSRLRGKDCFCLVSPFVILVHFCSCDAILLRAFPRRQPSSRSGDSCRSALPTLHVSFAPVRAGVDARVPCRRWSKRRPWVALTRPDSALIDPWGKVREGERHRRFERPATGPNWPSVQATCGAGRPPCATSAAAC